MECLWLVYGDCSECYHVGPIASDEELTLADLYAKM